MYYATSHGCTDNECGDIVNNENCISRELAGQSTQCSRYKCNAFDIEEKGEKNRFGIHLELKPMRAQLLAFGL